MKPMLSLCLALFFAAATSQPVVLERLAQVYLPFEFGDGGSPVFCLGEAAAEQIVYDPETFFLYVSGNEQLRVLDLTEPSSPGVTFVKDVPGEVTDVALCGDYVAASIPGEPESLPGTVFIYAKYTAEDGMALQYEVKVGPLPDSIVFTPDCAKLIVANEGEAGVDKKGKFVNPEGSVSIINLDALAAGRRGVRTVDFKAFNEDTEQLTAAGVRWIWRGQALRPGRRAGQTLSKDLEPEQVVVSEDGKFVFVNLQENNALAILDLATNRFTTLTGYGEKDLSQRMNALDTSDTDGPGMLRTWQGLFALYQPDVISVFNHEGEDYIITANEGDQKEYNPEDQGISEEWVEYGDGIEFVNKTTGLPRATVEALTDLDQLGGLPISKVDGVAEVTEEGEIYDRLVTYGGRSWSIYRASDMKQVYDSGSDFERVLAAFIPWAFNSDEVDPLCLRLPPEAEAIAEASLELEAIVDPDYLNELIEEANTETERLEALLAAPASEGEVIVFPSNALTTTPNDTVDSRSTSRGPEPESLIVGYLGERRIVFVGVEKGNAIFVYDATDPLAPIWQSTIYPGARGKTWAELYNNREIADIDPEGMEFVSREDSPSGEPLLIVSGAISGTVSIYAVRTGAANQDCDREADVIDDGKTTLVISTQTEGC